VQRSTIGIGPALRKARLARGVSIDEAARDTRIRAELLDALEEEEFDRLLGDVYVRGCLRSYATYLGLSPDKVVARYADQAEEPTPRPTAHPPPRPADPGISTRRRDNHRLIGMIATTALILAAAFGLISTRHSTPTPAELRVQGPAAAVVPTRGITVAVLATEPVDVIVRSDDAPPEPPIHLRPGEGRSFEADARITVRLSDGGSAQVTVNGTEQPLGVPGKPWKETFSFDAASAAAGG
jgi:cytoskeleton protein RodZ